MKLTSESKILIGIVVATIAIIGVALVAFSKPDPTYACSELIPDGSHVAGNPDAKVCVVEFSDFECPACATFEPIVSSLIEDYGDRIAVVFRHFPLPGHSYSKNAALAAEAAGVQGKFWEMTKNLYMNQNSLNDETVLKIARELDLDMDRFESSLTDPLLIQKVETDAQDAIRLGVNATPTFFVQGKKLTLFSQDDLAKAVENALR